MNLEKLKPHYSEVGDCWEWHGALQGGDVPCMRVKVDGKWKVVAVRRWIAMEQGKAVKGRLATTKCDNPRCICPDHVVLYTRKQLQERNGQKIKRNMNDAQRAKRAEARRRRGVKITQEMAHEIRGSGLSSRVIAKQYGVTQKTALRCLSGQSHRDYSNPFAGLMR